MALTEKEQQNIDNDLTTDGRIPPICYHTEEYAYSEYDEYYDDSEYADYRENDYNYGRRSSETE